MFPNLCHLSIPLLHWYIHDLTTYTITTSTINHEDRLGLSTSIPL